MNSRGWKISLLVVSALALSACGKKKHRPSSPYQGIWMEQRSLRALADARGAGWNCQAIAGVRKAFIVQPNGEVFTYIPDSRLSEAEARDYYLGAVNEASIFAPVNGQRLVAGGYYGDMDSVGLQPNSRFILDQGVLIAQSRFGGSAVFVPVSPEQARRVWVAAVRCQSNGAMMMAPGPGPGPGQQFIDQGFQQQHPNQGQRPLRQDDK